MIHEIQKPEISPAFTIDDIHKIRRWNYDRLKDATPEERRADSSRRTEEALKVLGLSFGQNNPKYEIGEEDYTQERGEMLKDFTTESILAGIGKQKKCE
jgi:hypothetical protein